MAKKYVTRCVVKRDGKQYKKGDFIEGLSEKEIQQGLDQNWLIAIGNDDTGSGDKTADAENAIDRMNKVELLAKAKELGIETTETMTKAELVALIKEKQAV